MSEIIHVSVGFMLCSLALSAIVGAFTVMALLWRDKL